jgi:hypothetical protein
MITDVDGGAGQIMATNPTEVITTNNMDKATGAGGLSTEGDARETAVKSVLKKSHPVHGGQKRKNEI